MTRSPPVLGALVVAVAVSLALAACVGTDSQRPSSRGASPPRSAPPTNPTPPPPPQMPSRTESSVAEPDPVFVGAGDIASCDSTGDEATAALLDAVFNGGASGLVFTAGDNAYGSGTPQQFTDCYDPTWGRHKARTRPTPGNHDYRNYTDSAFGYFAYFGAAAGDPDKGYYSYDLGAWHIIALNSNCSDIGGCGPGSPQEQWLRADLDAHPAACTLAYWHHPRFSSGEHGNDPTSDAFWRALYEYGAEVVLTGHDHDYERFAPQNSDAHSDQQRGIRLFIIGTGGDSLRQFQRLAANSEVRHNDTFGVLKLTLHATSYDWEFIPEAGNSFTDTGSQSCH